MGKIKKGDWLIPIGQSKLRRLIMPDIMIPPKRYLWKIRRVKDFGSYMNHKGMIVVYRIGRGNAHDAKYSYAHAEDCIHIPYEDMPWLGEDSL